MRVAIVLTGISYDPRNRDWQLTKENINKNIINCWPSNYQISTYLTTYRHETLDGLLNWYKPKKYNVLDLNGSDQRLTYAKSMELLINEEIDFTIATRFDISFNQELIKYPIDFNKFNFLFKEGSGWWESHNFTTDNLFIFNNKYLNQFIDSIYDIYYNPVRRFSDLHPIYSRLVPIIGENNINFLTNEITLSHNNKHYKLIRK